MSDILEDLTPAQREAVTHMDGPLMVIAGAGSGKTRVVTRRIAHLVSKGVWPNQILAMTFTNKAANEMKERVAGLVGVAPRWVGTFHSACARFLRRDMDKLEDGRSGRYTIYDTDDQTALVKLCMKELDLDPKELKPRQVREEISRAKCKGTPPVEYGRGYYRDELIARVYEAYEKRLRELDAVDFDDLLLLTVRLLEEQPHVRDIYHSRFRYVLVDEYQDTNRIQYRLVRLLTGPGRNVHVTGDPDQSIYSWRGADYRNIMDFSSDYEDVRLVRLEQNYRSTKTILHAANELIRHNSERIDKELFTENPAGAQVKVASLPDESSEAEWVAERAATLRSEGCSLREMAVFYRTNAQSRPFEEALMSVGVPYQIVGGIRFYERREIKDLLAHLRLLVNPRDVVSLQRVINCRPTGIGPRTLAKLTALANKHNEGVFAFLQREDFADLYGGRVPARLGAFAHWCRQLAQIPFAPVSECVHAVLEQSLLVELYRSKVEVEPSAADRVENLLAFIGRAMQFEQGRPDADLPAFLEDVALVADVDYWEDASECVSLMTLHSSKGLEFRYVFIVGVEDGLLPHQNSDTPRALEEERRLFYVGITRAKQEAAVTHAANRYIWGQPGERWPSFFLDELPEDALERIDLADVGLDW